MLMAITTWMRRVEDFELIRCKPMIAIIDHAQCAEDIMLARERDAYRRHPDVFPGWYAPRRMSDSVDVTTLWCLPDANATWLSKARGRWRTRPAASWYRLDDRRCESPQRFPTVTIAAVFAANCNTSMFPPETVRLRDPFAVTFRGVSPVVRRAGGLVPASERSRSPARPALDSDRASQPLAL